MTKSYDDRVKVYTNDTGQFKTLTEGSKDYEAKATMLKFRGFTTEVKGDERIRFLDSMMKSFEAQGIEFVGVVRP